MQQTSDFASISRSQKFSSGTVKVSDKTAGLEGHAEFEIERFPSRKADDSLTKLGELAQMRSEDFVVDEEVYQQMLETQAQMASKMVMGELTRSEILKLHMLRWAIGRAEAAKYKENLEQLRALAILHEDLARQVDRLVAAVKK